MDHKRDTITLYTAQTDAVCAVIERDGACFSKADYVRRKYGESGPVFLTAYQWFARQARHIVPPPQQAELPYWAFAQLYSVEAADDSRVLTLQVPRAQAVFFDMYDWYRVLQGKYLGETEAEERAFRQELALRGLTENAVMLSSFYPEQKEKILASWQRLFRHHHSIAAGDDSGARAVQAALWQIRKEWIVDIR